MAADLVSAARVYGKGNRLLQRGETRYRWDDDGRLVEKRTASPTAGEPDEVWRYHYNAAGLLGEVERPDGGRVRFAYDPFARRVAKEVYQKEGSSLRLLRRTRFVWDGDVLAHELSRAEREGDPVEEVRTYLHEDGSFEPVAHREDGAGWVHYVNDPIGTPERLVDETGAVCCELRRRAWGRTEVLPGARATTPIRFQGQYADDETGLRYNRWRYYDPEAGRFTSADPVGLRGGCNRFRGLHNPVAWSDPLGLACERACAAGGSQGLDWSIVSEKTGETRATHVGKHGVNNLQKRSHGVFHGNPMAAVDDAWAIAQRTGVKPTTVGGSDIYVVPRTNSGYAGGYGGQGQNLNSVTIVTQTGTNKLVTGFPGNGVPTPKP